MEFDYTKTLKILKSQQVDFIIVGGYAVNIHGYNRSTSDLDIWVSPILENRAKVIASLLELGFTQQELSPVYELDFVKPFCFKLGNKPWEMDIMNYIVGTTFNEAWKSKVEYAFDEGVIVPYLSYKDLIANKLISGRPKDKLDVDELIKIHRLRGDE